MLLFLILIILCLIKPENTVEITNQAIFLWAKNVLPTLLPFFIISKYMLNLGGERFFSKLFKPITTVLGLPNSSAFSIFISIFCGFPLGSIIVENVYKSSKDKEYYANVCFSASSVFILATVGSSILSSSADGIALFVINLCTFFIFAVLTKPQYLSEQNFEIKKSEPISESVSAIFNVCGNMILFLLISSLFTRFIKNKFLLALITGVFEFTSGIKMLSLFGSDTLPLISFFISFGGLCVIFQCFGQLTSINKVKFILSRFFCGAISFLLCFLYKKTALIVPIIITVLVITVCNLGRKRLYFLKSSRS